VILSSATLVGDQRDRKKYGLEAWLVKPVKQSELLTLLLTILGEIYPQKPTLSPSETLHDETLHHRKANILLAEDNAINRTFAVRLLEKAGHDVACAKNGEEVLSLMAKRKFDMILMDVSMPELDGYEATRRIRNAEKQTGHHIPIIAMTAHALKEDRCRCLEAGMDEYISKPVNVKELFEKIDLFIGNPINPGV